MKRLLLLSLAFTACAGAAPIDSVNVFIGTGAHGHTFPGATVPHGMVQLSPDTRTTGWEACAGYAYDDKTILGFSHMHLSGTGIADFGNILLLPLTGTLNEPNAYRQLAADRFKSEFSHERESAKPGYYQVKLDKYGIGVELTATAHAGMHRYTFPESAQSHVLLDLVHGLNNSSPVSSVNVEGPTLVTGFRRTDGWSKGTVIFFAMEFSQPFKSYGLELGGKEAAGTNNVEGRGVRAHFDYQTSPGQEILVRVGLSPTSVEAAKANLKAEISSWDFNAVRKATQDFWNEQLSRIQVESSDLVIRETFYTSLYHSMMAPNLFNNVDGSYRGNDGKTHTATDFQYYSTFSLWDTFRAEHPLMTLTEPSRINDYLRTMLAYYDDSNGRALPMWPLASFETWCMIGYNSVPVIVDAYNKGFRGFDTEKMFQAMLATTKNSKYDADDYQRLNYVPNNRRGANGAARTLEYSFDDWCISQFARSLGKNEEADRFLKRSQNYTNLFDAKVGFFRGRGADGSFRESFDPKVIDTTDYIEANAWEYNFAAMHDVAGMIKLYGGNEGFIRKLDELFDQDSDVHQHKVDQSGLYGQYAHGNEPCHHVAYLYAMAGAQYKTARRVHQIMLLQYNNTPEGICGNDDCGQMSAWYTWSAIGLYPVNPADGKYVFGSPLVSKAVIQLDPKFYKGGTFTILAKNASNQNIYIQSAKLNGKLLDRPWVTHDEVTAGGTLEFEMGILPVKSQN